jgi:hypothetical protein
MAVVFRVRERLGRHQGIFKMILARASRLSVQVAFHWFIFDRWASLAAACTDSQSRASLRASAPGDRVFHVKDRAPPEVVSRRGYELVSAALSTLERRWTLEKSGRLKRTNRPPLTSFLE